MSKKFFLESLITIVSLFLSFELVEAATLPASDASLFAGERISIWQFIVLVLCVHTLSTWFTTLLKGAFPALLADAKN